MSEEDNVYIRSNSNKLFQSPQSSRNDKDNSRELEDVESRTWSKYEIFLYTVTYLAMFLTRLGKDLFKSILVYFYSENMVPGHILDLTKTSKKLHLENMSRKATSIRHLTWIQGIKFSLRHYFKAFKSYLLPSEDDKNFHYSKKKIFIKEKSYLPTGSNKDFSSNSIIMKTPTGSSPIIENTTPSTSKRNTDNASTEFIAADNTTTAQNLDLQIEKNSVNDSEDDDSIVIAYLKDKDVKVNVEKLSTRKNITSLLEKVPKMETIQEGEQFSAFPDTFLSEDGEISPGSEDVELSESSLDVHIPSFPGSPRSLNVGSEISIESQEQDLNFAAAIEFLHEDRDFLIAAETGNHKVLQVHLRNKEKIQQMDHLGRNALHLAVCSDNETAVMLLLDTELDTNVKDNLGMTPLSLCLMRRPSYKIAKLLFDHGAEIAERSNPVDTGLFLQFVMMCTPTEEDVKILNLLIEKGAIVNDPEAPGGRQALHFAAMSNNCELIQILFNLGADLTLKNNRNETPKQVAETFKCKEAYELLLWLEEGSEYSSRFGSTLLNIN